jgi:CHU_C Type IX secretion signal domain
MHNRQRLKYLILLPMLLLFFKAWAQPHCKVLIFIYPDFCNNAMITLDAHTYGNVTPPITYLWSTGETTSSISVPNASGTYSVTITDAVGCMSMHTVDLLIPQNFSIYIQEFNNCPGQTIILDVEWTQFEKPLNVTYLWSTGETTEYIEVPGPGTYSVTLTDPATGCSQVYTKTVDFLPGPMPTITGPANLCTGQSGTLSVLGGPFDSYYWSPNFEANPTIDITGPGTYVVTVTNTFGCTASDEFVVQSSGTIPILSGPTILCQNQTGTITINNVASFNDFLWSTSETTPFINISGPGTYSVTATDLNGCEGMASLDISGSAFSLSGTVTNVTLCSTPNGSIDIDVFPPGTHSYLWSNGASTEDISNLTENTYTVTVTESGGCTNTASFVVQNNSVSFTVDGTYTNATCGMSNGSVDLSIQPSGTYTYLWSNGASTQDIANLSPNTYSVTVTSSSGCTATYSTTIVNTNTPININGTANDNSSCTSPNGSINVSIIPAASYTYSWSNGANTEDLTDINGGTYTITVTSSNGCTSEATFIVANNILLPSISSGIINATCGQNNGTIDITVLPSAAYTFLWSNGATTEDLVNIASGIYTITVTSAQGCTASHTANVNNVNTSFTISGLVTPVTSCTTVNGGVDVTVTPSGTYTYLWSNGSTNQDLTNVAAGNYILTVADANGCSSTSEFPVASIISSPSITSNIVNTACGQSNGSIDITVLPSAAYTFIWSNAATTEDLVNIGTGTYIVTVTSAQGCTASHTANVTNTNTSFTFSGITKPVTSCTSANGSVDVTVTPSGNYTYQWSNGMTTQDLSNIAAGTYNLTITDNSNCSTITAYTVIDSLSKLLILSNVISASCGKNNGQINLDVTPLGTYNFAWSNGDNTEDLSNLAAGGYTVTVTSSEGCTALQTIMVAKANPPFFISGAIMNVTSCTKANGSITITTTPLGTYTYLWENGNTSDRLTDVGSGSYTVTVTDAGACSISETYIIDDLTTTPSITSNTINASCGNDNGAINITVLPIGSYTYKWSNNTTAEDAINIGIGSYTVTVTSVDGCTSIHTTSVINTNSNFTINGIVQPVTSCLLANGSIDISVSSNGTYTYTWSNGSTSPDITNLDIGTYTVTVTDANACKVIDSFDITNGNAIPSLLSIITNPTCWDNSGAIDLVVSPSGSYNYVWTNGVTTEDISALYTGTYTVTVTSADGCTATHTAIVGNQNFNLKIDGKSKPQSSCISANGSVDISLSLNINCSYLWSNGSTTQDINNVNAGSYTVTITTQNGCQLTYNTEVAESFVEPIADVSVHYTPCDHLSNWIEVIDTSSNEYSIDNGITFTSEKKLLDLKEGQYELIVKNKDGCTATVPFEIIHQEIVKLNIDSLVYVKSGQNYLLQLKIDQKYFDLIDTIIWKQSDLLQFSTTSKEGLMNPTLTAQQSMSIDVSVILKNQCELQKRIRIEVVDSILISVPNIIDPSNGSTNNGAFTIYTSVPENSEINYLRIYDRWGNKVFERNNFMPNAPELGWDGTFNGTPLNPAVFAWVAQIKNGGQVYLKHGDVTLVK